MMDYDVNPITVKVQYNFKEYREYFIFSMFRGKRYRLRKWLFFIGYPLLIVFLTYLAVFYGPDSFLVFCDTIIVFVFAFYLFIILFLPQKNYKRMQKLFSSGILFQFRNNDIIVNQNNDLYTGESKINYALLFKVYETGTMFYVFLTPKQAFLINKNRINQDNQDNIRTILKDKVGKKKYVKCYG